MFQCYLSGRLQERKFISYNGSVGRDTFSEEHVRWYLIPEIYSVYRSNFRDVGGGRGSFRVEEKRVIIVTGNASASIVTMILSKPDRTSGGLFGGALGRSVELTKLQDRN